jgi:hypothetical protein
MSLKLNSSGGGSVLLQEPVTASTLTLNLPAFSGTAATLASVTNNGVLYVNSSGQPTTGSALTFDGSTLLNAGMVRATTLSVINSTSPINQFANFNVDSTGLDINSTYVTSGSGTVRFSIASSEQMRLTSTGLGIGTSSPITKLGVVGNAIFSGSNPFISLAYNQAGSTPCYWELGADGVATLHNLGNGSNNGVWRFIGGGGSEFMRLDSSGNLGLGVTPSAWSSQAKALEIGIYAGFYRNASGLTEVAFNSYQNTINFDTYRVSANPAAKYQIGGGHAWFVAPSGTAGNAISFTQAMTLNASGALLLGKSATNIANAGWELGPNGGAQTVTISGSNQAFVYNNTSTSGTATVAFRTAGVEKGYIAWTNSATSYSTTSDYRLKNTVAPMTGALAKVALLKPCTYKWKADGSDGEGFIAHELAEVCPSAVTGAKDAVDTEGNPQYQGIDTSFLVATVVAALQELKAELDTVKAELAAMKGTA